MNHTITAITDSAIYSTPHRRAENQDQAFQLTLQECPGATGGIWMGLCADGTSDSNGREAARLAMHVGCSGAAQLLARLPELSDAVDAADSYDEIQSAHEKIIFPILREMIFSAHRVLEAQPLCASTISGAVIYDGVVYTANVGDSPIWLLSPDDLGHWQARRLYTCHNKAGELERSGKPSQDPRDASRLQGWIGHRRPQDKPFTTDSIAIAAQVLPTQSILLLGSDGALDMHMDPLTMDLAANCQSMDQLVRQLLKRKEDDIRATDNFTLIAARVYVSA